MSTTTLKKGARAVADTGAGTILAAVEIAAPPERVFRALTTDEVTKWWGSADWYRTTEYTADLRPGGRWRSAGVGADGKSFSVEGEFREIDPPRKLVHTWKAPWDGDQETVVTYRLEAIDGGTRVTLRHDGFAGRAESCSGHGQGWERVLGWLTKFVESAKPASDKRYFFLRLIPPRATFPADITPAEMALMREHGDYWRTLLLPGPAIVVGPVADPKGAFGMAVVRAAGPDEVQRLVEVDPVIRAGQGFRFEVLPMMSAIVPE
jgi:uncharacterized protein YndB with AHSA1/START domain